MALYQLKESVKRRLFGTTEVKQPTPAPIPEGFEIVQPDPKPKAQQAPAKVDVTQQAPKTEAQPSVAASTETPKPAPRVAPIAQASAAPVQKAPETPKATLATSDAVETPRQAPASALGQPRYSVADAKSSEQPQYRSSIEFGSRTFQRGTVHDLLEDFGVTRHHAQLICKLESFCSPFDTRRQCSRDVRRVLVATWGDAEALRHKLSTSPGHKPPSGSSRPQWTDGLSVLGLGHSLDEVFVVNSITQQAKQLRPEIVLIWDRPELLEAFNGSEVRANALLGQLAAKTGAVVLLYRNIKDY